MKAQQIDPKDLKIHLNEVPIPTPAPNEILVKILCASLCHSDIMIFEPTEGMQYPEKPTTMGHEATGQIVQLGSDVSGFNIGDNVGFNPATQVCYECRPCREVHNLWCEKNAPVIQGFGRDGYFAEYAVIDHHNAIVLPRELDPVAAAPLFCAGVTAYHAIDDLKLPHQSWVAIIGCGGLGLLAIQYARAMQYRVIAIDTAVPALEEAKASGAEHAFDPANDADYVSRIMEITGRGVHAAVNFTASKRAYAAMPAIIRPGNGILMAVGIPAQPIELSVFDIALQKYRVMGASNGQCHNTRPAIEFSAKHNIVSKTEYFPLEDLPTMVEKMQNHTARGRMAVRF
ncbi:chaperonin 10-like protein [Emericellopsis atlantica]|uniref:Chaperonin 10-like protein n=1 Tax=Emericellopsis atlantica TaxID=2614577 RepID=A0A9P7ZPC4_9HYPO|nr:chaperonin 10-like protein [Emericellopsis atlantica]KAG9255641.1 chaperonin 10-like protein [Emericellopsis atlantica]